MWSPVDEISVSRAGNPLEPLPAGSWLEAVCLRPLPTSNKGSDLLLTLSKDLQTISNRVEFTGSLN